MDFQSAVFYVEELILTKPILAIIVLSVLLLFAYKKPKPFLKMAMLTIFGIAIFYVATSVQDAVFSGVDSKEGIIEKQDSY